jgi:hypothetical protein
MASFKDAFCAGLLKYAFFLFEFSRLRSAVNVIMQCHRLLQVVAMILPGIAWEDEFIPVMRDFHLYLCLGDRDTERFCQNSEK